jgi:hypothetical protein
MSDSPVIISSWLKGVRSTLAIYARNPSSWQVLDFAITAAGIEWHDQQLEIYKVSIWQAWRHLYPDHELSEKQEAQLKLWGILK